MGWPITWQPRENNLEEKYVILIIVFTKKLENNDVDLLNRIGEKVNCYRTTVLEYLSTLSI